MERLKGALISYLAIQGFLLLAPLFLVMASLPAVFVGGILAKLGFEQETTQFFMFGTVLVSIYVFFQIYSAVRMKQIDMKLAKHDRSEKK